MPTSINYRFTQRFRVSADRAYKWCTSYDPSDLELMHENGKREIEQLSKDAFILTDTFHKGSESFSKTKLVRLHPREMFWTNTHIAGPNKYSQFLYKIVPEGKDKSRLDFVGLQLEPQDMTRKQATAFARKVRKEDSGSWKHLASAMEKELLK
ncbi:MAG: hypothetical protein JRN52_09135 [Nitrososphaerota archaeon]|nr:hypothetical protein [Nitrososphaerota archaeon]